MSDWAKGYRAGLSDIKQLAAFRHMLDLHLLQLLADLEQDSRVIEHEVENKVLRRRLRGREKKLADIWGGAGGPPGSH